MTHENDHDGSAARTPTTEASLSAPTATGSQGPRRPSALPGRDTGAPARREGGTGPSAPHTPQATEPADPAAAPIGPRPLPDLTRRIAVMGIVNRTRDSFFDQGRTFALEAAVEAGMAAAAEGADIIDVGGVKFAPGAPLP